MTVTLTLFSLTVACTSAAQVFQKYAALRSIKESGNTSSGNLIFPGIEILVSGVLLAVGLLLWIQLLNRIDVSLAYPLLSINYVVVLLCARLVFEERIPSYRWVGVFAIIAGIYLLLGSAVS